jgi:N-acetylated-alpha-linked acidic dipeptidase
MKSLSLSLLFVLCSTVAGWAQGPPVSTLRGFPDEEAKARRPFEERLRATAEANRIREYMNKMAAEPHHAGSANSKAVAEYALSQFKSFGLDARLESFDVLLPYPVLRSLEVVSPVRFEAKLREPAIKEDVDSMDANQLPGFAAFSANGDVTAPLVYANFGLPEDYALLRQKGIDVKGKIVLVRYGRSFRGIKPKVAAEMGAIACLIYSDPKDDGFYQGYVYPKGPFRPPSGVQRGSVLDLPLYPGDPLTPGRPSIAGVARLKLEDAKSIQKIPVLPIAWEDAKPLLEQLNGEMAPAEWRGAVPVPYHLGPGPAVVRLRVQSDNATRTIYNVIAKLPGNLFPEQQIIYGNHHDAWVNGAADPISGAASVLEAARILSKSVKQGWKPKRSIVFALWDGEEYGLLGSTEWVEKHRDELLRNAVAYFNSDTTLRGPMRIQASPSLEKFIEEWMRDFPDPGSGKTLLEATGKFEFRAGALGSGSDYTAFAHHLGVASLNAGYEGNMSGVYHSTYDSLRWFQYFGDPDYVFTTSFAGFMATGLARFADAYWVPIDFGRMQDFLNSTVEDLKKLSRGKNLAWESVDRELERFAATRRLFGQQIRPAYARVANADRGKLRRLNEALFTADRIWTRPEGLPGREWYKNLLSAPGKYTGYGAKTLPGIREAIEANRPEEAQTQIRVLSETIAAYTERVRLATKLAAEL